MDINHNQCTNAAIDAQDAGRELSRLEATVIAQYLCGEAEPDFWFNVYYNPQKVRNAISEIMLENYMHSQWDERIAWDMLGTYCINVDSL